MISSTEVLAPRRTLRLAGGMTDVALLAYPAVLHTLSDTIMQVVDSAIVGRLGVTELGAVGFGGIWLWTATVVFVGTATGVQTFVAQAFGARRPGTCGQWVWHALYVLIPLAAVWFALLGVGIGPLLEWLGPSPELRRLAAAYVHARVLGAPAVVAGVVLTSFFRGLGDTRTPLIATVVANALNVVLAYGLVFGRWGLPAWGIAGAGAASAAALWVYTAIMLYVFLRPRMAAIYHTRPIRPVLAASWRFLRTSAPIGGQWFLDMGSFAIFSTIIARMGDTQMAASQAMIQLLSLSFMQAYGISIAATALVGRYVGAGDLHAATRSHGSAMRLGLGLATAVAVLFVIVPDRLLGLFTTDAQVIAFGQPLLALGALFQLIDAVGIIAGGSLRGAGDTRWPFVMQASLAWLLRLPLVYPCAIVLGGGVFGAWLGELGYVAVLGSSWLLRFRTGAWRAIRI